jgi:hypothetical protein
VFITCFVGVYASVCLCNNEMSVMLFEGLELRSSELRHISEENVKSLLYGTLEEYCGLT